MNETQSQGKESGKTRLKSRIKPKMIFGKKESTRNLQICLKSKSKDSFLWKLVFVAEIVGDGNELADAAWQIKNFPCKG